MSQYRNFS